MEISRAWADDSNDVSHMSISHFKYLLTLILTGGLKWLADDDVSHLSISHL